MYGVYWVPWNLTPSALASEVDHSILYTKKTVNRIDRPLNANDDVSDFDRNRSWCATVVYACLFDLFVQFLHGAPATRSCTPLPTILIKIYGILYFTTKWACTLFWLLSWEFHSDLIVALPLGNRPYSLIIADLAQHYGSYLKVPLLVFKGTRDLYSISSMGNTLTWTHSLPA